MYQVSGAHHVALGVKNLERMKSFYRDVLGFNQEVMDIPQSAHPEISEVMRGVTPVFAGSLIAHPAGGILLELIQMITPAPRAIRPDFRYGDIGLNKMTITVFDVEKFYRGFNDKVNFCSAPKSTIIAGLGDYHFVYAKDPEGNLLEFVSAANLPANDRFGSIHWLGIGVTDLPRSITFYQKFAGLSTTVIDIHESFSGLAGEVSGGRLSRVLSCLLSTGQGAGMLELFEVTQPRGRSIPAFTQWGDYGFWQACLLCDDSDKAAEYFTQTGVPFFSSLQHMPDGGAFIYVQDPDGIPLEFLSFPQNP